MDSLSITASPKVLCPTKGNKPYSRSKSKEVQLVDLHLNTSMCIMNVLSHIQNGVPVRSNKWPSVKQNISPYICSSQSVVKLNNYLRLSTGFHEEQTCMERGAEISVTRVKHLYGFLGYPLAVIVSDTYHSLLQTVLLRHMSHPAKQRRWTLSVKTIYLCTVVSRKSTHSQKSTHPLLLTHFAV